MVRAVSERKSNLKFSQNSVVNVCREKAGSGAISNCPASYKARLDSMTRCITSAPPPLVFNHKVVDSTTWSGESQSPVNCFASRCDETR